jgi:uncharacterized protein (DUF433 family)
MVMEITGIDLTHGPRIAGTRITVFDIFYYLDRRRSATEIGDILQLTPEQVQAGMRYIEAHRSDVEAVHRRIEERNARGNPPEIQAFLDAGHARFLEMVESRRRRNGPGPDNARNSGGQ